MGNMAFVGRSAEGIFQGDGVTVGEGGDFELHGNRYVL
jgi:hypothetical protein